jgi:hypothetical protein
MSQNGFCFYENQYFSEHGKKRKIVDCLCLHQRGVAEQDHYMTYFFVLFKHHFVMQPNGKCPVVQPLEAKEYGYCTLSLQGENINYFIFAAHTCTLENICPVS